MYNSYFEDDAIFEDIEYGKILLKTYHDEFLFKNISEPIVEVMSSKSNWKSSKYKKNLQDKNGKRGKGKNYDKIFNVVLDWENYYKIKIFV